MVERKFVTHYETKAHVLKKNPSFITSCQESLTLIMFSVPFSSELLWLYRVCTADERSLKIKSTQKILGKLLVYSDGSHGSLGSPVSHGSHVNFGIHGSFGSLGFHGSPGPHGSLWCLGLNGILVLLI